MLNKIMSLMGLFILIGHSALAMDSSDGWASRFVHHYAMTASGSGGPGPDPDLKEYFNFNVLEAELMENSSFIDLAAYHELMGRYNLLRDPFNPKEELEKQQTRYLEECQQSCMPLVPTDVFPLIMQYLLPRDYAALLLAAKRLYGIGCDKPVILLNLKYMIANPTSINPHHLEMATEFNDMYRSGPADKVAKVAQDAKRVEFENKYEIDIKSLVYASRFYIKIYEYSVSLNSKGVLDCSYFITPSYFNFQKSLMPSGPLCELYRAYENFKKIFNEKIEGSIFPLFLSDALSYYSCSKLTPLDDFRVINFQPPLNLNLFLKADEDESHDEEKTDEGNL